MNFATFVRKANLLKRRCEKCRDAVRQIEITVNQSSLTDILTKRLTGYHDEIVEKKRDFEHVLNLCLSEDPSGYDEDTVLTFQDDINDLFNECRGIVLSIIPHLNDNSQPPTVNSESAVAHIPTAVRLPKLELPRFSGDSVKWMSFYNTFDTTIHQSASLSRVEKFQYLNSCLQGEALDLIRGLPLSESNYLIAWDLLIKRYHNQRKLVSMHINKILDMPSVSGNSLISLRSFLSTFHENAQALSALGHDISNENTLLVTILMRKLDFATRKRMEDTRRETHELPLASELITFLERECAHLEDASVDARVKTVLATSSKNFLGRQPRSGLLSLSVNRCPFCSDGTHSIYQCSEFKGKSPQERQSIARTKRWCFNCLGRSHNKNSCKSTQCCRICHRKHHSLLHVAHHSDPSTSSSQKPSVSTHAFSGLSSGSLPVEQPSTSGVAA